MVYLYAALGVVMMTGIMTIFEMGLSLTESSSLLLKPENSYQSNLLDRKLLYLLHDSDHLAAIKSGDSENHCENILGRIRKCKAQASSACEQAASLENDYRLSIGADSLAENFSGACALQANNMHRILIRPDPSKNDSYRLFSCGLTEKVRVCDFELSD